MNVSEFTSLINQPELVHDKQTDVLEKIAQEFPYFQSARALYLKGLYNQNSFKYNYALKIAAAHTTDRGVLFDFITSDSFSNITPNQQTTEEVVLASDETTEVVTQEAEIEIPQETEVKLEQRDNTIEQSLLDSIKEAEEAQIETKVTEQITSEILEPEIQEIEIEQQEAIQEIREEKLDLGKPLNFSVGETHSFQEWLQLSNLKPIQRAENPEPETPASEIDFEKQKKNELIDKFIEANPKIPKIKPDAPLPTVFYESSNADASALMTETLARVYLEQKKYQKAIQAYEILILKYPEKSSFFADRILDIKNLQQNNK
jgi:tetratricopeptide (TPR) repeat protein